MQTQLPHVNKWGRVHLLAIVAVLYTKTMLFVPTFEESAECICLGGFFIQSIFSSLSETYTCTRITLLARLSVQDETSPSERLSSYFDAESLA